MKLRTAIKICRVVYGHELKRIKQHVKLNYRWPIIDRARRVCNRRKRWLNDERIPYIPDEEELTEQAEIFGCLMLDMAKAFGVPEDEVEAKRDEFLVALHKE